MNINAAIIDQRLAPLIAEISEPAKLQLGISESEKLKSLAFVYLCVKTLLDLGSEETFDCLTEGGGDFGIDAMKIEDIADGEFAVVLIQAKYTRNLEKEANFPESGLSALVNAIRYLFDPSGQLQSINSRLQAKVEEARSLIRDGLIPRIRAIACNNGIKWNAAGDEIISRANFGNQVTWEYVNHNILIGLMQKVTQVTETLRLVGKAIIEDVYFSRVCIGRIPVSEIAALMARHGDKLLERNIRRYLGLHGNRVNKGIQNTLHSQPHNFYFFNNGLTFICSDFSYNALQQSDFQVKVEDLQIVNGGQTSMTIFKTMEAMQQNALSLSQDASVLIRIYKLPKDNEDVVLQITQATNSQNPVDLKDLRSNDEKQKKLELSIESLGFAYRRKRVSDVPTRTEITAGVAAEAILAVWRSAPHQAKFFTREHFGKLYDSIFLDTLNGAQLIAAVLLYRIAENHRRRPAEGAPNLVRYASCFIAMQMGACLLEDMSITLTGLTHKNFEQAQGLIEQKGEAYFQAAVVDVDNALKSLYGAHDISFQQLAATFRRGDLIQLLKASPLHWVTSNS